MRVYKKKKKKKKKEKKKKKKKKNKLMGFAHASLPPPTKMQKEVKQKTLTLSGPSIGLPESALRVTGLRIAYELEGDLKGRRGEREGPEGREGGSDGDGGSGTSASGSRTMRVSWETLI
uniref:Uncharacterized protein n=1 Tax=Vespula pensylvanica TaxID=30213 RepID=A0A834PGM8_VESPE|nr:hypothetical protein H0235_001719 [Vespula pensylvanica]